MSVVTLIIGDSGSGKSSSLQKLDATKSLLIQPRKKSLPFRSPEWRKRFTAKDQSGSLYVSSNYEMIANAIDAAIDSGKKIIILDDANYLMQAESLEHSEQKGYDKFTAMAKNYVNLIDHCINHDDDVRFYIMTHSQTDDSTGYVKPKTVGKMIDNQVVLEGLFTIVLRCYSKDKQHYFSTKTNGNDCVKSPIGMFNDDEIGNCLLFVDETIKDYEGINE